MLICGNLCQLSARYKCCFYFITFIKGFIVTVLYWVSCWLLVTWQGLEYLTGYSKFVLISSPLYYSHNFFVGFHISCCNGKYTFQFNTFQFNISSRFQVWCSKFYKMNPYVLIPMFKIMHLLFCFYRLFYSYVILIKNTKCACMS